MSDPTATLQSESTRRGLAVFEFYPMIKELGQERLQELCDGWVRTPDAFTYDVAGIEVGDASTSFALTMSWSGRLDAPLADRFPKFVASLFRYIIDHGLTGNAQEVARLLSARIVPPESPVPPPRMGTSSFGRKM
ncbi:MAG: hypothetical protein U0835_23665 [Isosphaeraceae bacterium]